MTLWLIVLGLIGLIGLVVFFIWRSLVVAWMLNRMMPPTWRPPAWMWQYEFVMRKRGKRKCAQCGLRREPYHRLRPWREVYITRVHDGRINRPVVARRPPYLCPDCIVELTDKGCREIRVGEAGHARFVHNGKAVPYPAVGEGLYMWATTTA